MPVRQQDRGGQFSGIHETEIDALSGQRVNGMSRIANQRQPGADIGCRVLSPQRNRGARAVEGQRAEPQFGRLGQRRRKGRIIERQQFAGAVIVG